MQAKRALSQNGTRRFARGTPILPVGGAPGEEDDAAALLGGAAFAESVMTANATLS
jgi:hypothetical protein